MVKIKVLAKAQNRRALGIFQAYLQINPKSTLDDLRQAFPNSLAPDKGVQEIFILSDKGGAYENWDGYFREADEQLQLSNGDAVSVVKMWTQASLSRLEQEAKQYGIIVEKQEDMKSGEIRLERLDEDSINSKNHSYKWVYILILIMLLAFSLFLWKTI